MSKCDKPILLSGIYYELTYVTLQLPHNFQCSSCQPKLDPLQTSVDHKRKKHKSNWLKYQQYWDGRWTRGKDRMEGNIKKYHRVQNYLKVEREVIIDYINGYRSTKEKPRTDNVRSSIQGENSLLHPNPNWYQQLVFL